MAVFENAMVLCADDILLSFNFITSAMISDTPMFIPFDFGRRGVVMNSPISYCGF